MFVVSSVEGGADDRPLLRFGVPLIKVGLAGLDSSSSSSSTTWSWTKTGF